jgi:acetyl esterase
MSMPSVAIEDVVVAATPEVLVRTYQPAATAHTTVLWIHGGAFVGGSLDQVEADAPCRVFAEAGMAAVSVAYRLAPGFASRAQRRPDAVRYPLPLDDCAAAWDWTSRRAQDQRLLIGGASAGATLAATLVLRLLRQGAPTPDAVLLAYPLLHAELPPLPPDVRRLLRGWRGLGTFSPRAVRWMSRNYVGPRGTDLLGEAFPAGRDLSGFPPTLIVDSEVDSLRASSVAFAAELGGHGVPVTHVVEPGTRHGHLDRSGSPAQRATLRRMTTWISEL